MATGEVAMPPHVSAREGQRQCVGLLVEAREGPDVGDFCTGEELKLRQSWWSVHTPK